MLFIDTEKLKAAMECAATSKAEPRYYLKGVLLEVTACGDVHLVSTDGERMFFGRIPAADVKWADTRPNGTREIILPYDALKQAMKHKRFTTFIEHLGGKGYSINGVPCQAIDGVFPNWRAVVLAALDKVSDGALPAMEWARVASVEGALRTWSGKKNATLRIKGGSDYAGLLCYGGDTNCLAVVMPQRRDEVTPDVLPTYPAALTE